VTIPVPNLDDRDFPALLSEARQWIEQHAPGWTDLSPSDPGMVVVELFAYLTDLMIYRLNRLPEKAYMEFLRLTGLTLRPPAAAAVTLRLQVDPASDQPIEVPQGTRVAANRPAAGGEPPVFVTAKAATIPAGAGSVEVLAHHCDLIQGELAGVGTGQPGQTVTAQRPPVVAPTGDELDLIVGVESTAAELGDRAPAIQLAGTAYRVWQEATSFVNLGPTDYVYVVDRLAGLITFAPAVRMPDASGELSDIAQAMAAVPPAGRAIRLWYRRGGGPAGNVAAGTLTVLRDPIPAVKVTNPAPAMGGRPAEDLENALIRGPQEVHAVERAITAHDYEAVAKRSSGAVVRARAFTMAELWRHAWPGTVQVLLVPFLSAEEQGPGHVPRTVIAEHETEAARSQIQTALDQRRPLGTTCTANWARYKTVKVAARVVVRREENLEAVRTRVGQRLYQTITPLPTEVSPRGWAFGQALRASNVFDMILREPGVRFADQVRLLIDEVPETNVRSIVADVFQPHTWYAGSGSTLFRSLNDGQGWEPAGRFPDEEIRRVRVHTERPGMVAVVTALSDGGSKLHISLDAGETWEPNAPTTSFHIDDVAWTTRDDMPIVLMASAVGLYELAWEPGATPVQVLVTQEEQAKGFYSVVISVDPRGEVSVALAGQGLSGVYLSSQGGAPGTFRSIGLVGEDIRVLEVQRDGPRSFLWAGTAAGGEDDPGKGCFRWELRGSAGSPDGWVPFAGNWKAGSCWGLAFLGNFVFAASHHGGVLRLDPTKSGAAWQAPGVNSGAAAQGSRQVPVRPGGGGRRRPSGGACARRGQAGRLPQHRPGSAV